MEIRKLRNSKDNFLNEQDLKNLRDEIESTLKAIGFISDVQTVNKGALRLRGVRLDKNKFNLNLSPHTGRRGAILSFKQWELINHCINVILDNRNYKATVESLNGLFKIRTGNTAKADYEDRAYDNIGSIGNPCYRRDAWTPDNESFFNHAMNEAIKYIQNRYQIPQYFKNFVDGNF